MISQEGGGEEEEEGEEGEEASANHKHTDALSVCLVFDKVHRMQRLLDHLLATFHPFYSPLLFSFFL